jgi:purine nucleosidase
MERKLLLDCDTGVDDTMAILYASLHEGIALVGVGSVWGNVDVPTATRNSLHAVAMTGVAGVPVAEGAAGPVSGRAPVYAYHVHGEDGQGNAGPRDFQAEPSGETAAEQIVRLARDHAGELDLVAVGPLTNLALALGLCPELPELMREVTIMGGAALAPGNVTPTAEANIWCDPEAAHAVFAARWPIVLVPLDVTMRVVLEEEHRTRLAAGGGIARYVAAITDFYFDFFAQAAFGRRCSAMHDALAVAIAARTVRPGLAPVVEVSVDTSDGPCRGTTVCDMRGRYRGYPEQEGAHCSVVLEVDAAFADAFVELLSAAGDSRIGAEVRSDG